MGKQRDVVNLSVSLSLGKQRDVVNLSVSCHCLILEAGGGGEAKDHGGRPDVLMPGYTFQVPLG